MNRFTKGAGLVTKVVLVSSSVALLGASCWQGVGTNTNVGLETNTNAVATNTLNENTNSSAEIDTSDWLTYTNEEYGFSFKYPRYWEINVIDNNDEGGMGTSLGSITMSSGNCQVFVDNVLAGTINKQKAEKNKALLEIESSSGVKGISFSDVVNENGSEGVIYMYEVGDNEIRFIPVSSPSDPTCRLDLEQIVSTLDIVS